jgi:hypothetical protein
MLDKNRTSLAKARPYRLYARDLLEPCLTKSFTSTCANTWTDAADGMVMVMAMPRGVSLIAGWVYSVLLDSDDGNAGG